MGDRPMAGPAWFRAHGLGNDYIVFRSGEAWTMTADAVAKVCDRTRGVGSDGIVLEIPPDPAHPGVFRLRMFNPDGSEFERSGNGLRVFGAALATAGRVGADPFDIEVGGGRVRMQVMGREAGGILDIAVEMGRASMDPHEVGVDIGRVEAPRGGQGTGTLLLQGGDRVTFRGVSVGNPHCVVFTDILSDSALQTLGPQLTSHPAFVNGANVQLARVEGPGVLRIAIWERGVGKTSASGTSSCAVAAAAVHEGRVEPGEILVLMEGGSLRVTVTPELDITLRGPVQEVARGVLTPGFLEFL